MQLCEQKLPKSKQQECISKNSYRVDCLVANHLHDAAVEAATLLHIVVGDIAALTGIEWRIS